ncbi:uncharacterized protein LOC119898281 [Micropterus salmoides]|uniref:uncharacterized protein LOC119898281 n=1 Tax=Micropterus salmoides TaxID=27706 RepID=UPI0018EB0BD2|nr:uncharacterized protein LOC119898281 [Micropterus salmoides]
MITGVRMRVLEVFLLAVLGCSLAEGRLVSKCELKDQLMTAFGALLVKAEKGQSVENLVAKIVCHVELTSQFNTSAVKQLTPRMENHHSREKREADRKGSFGKDEREDHSREREHHSGERPRPSKPRHTSTTRPTPSTNQQSTTFTNNTEPILPTLSTNPNQSGEPSTTIQARNRRDVKPPKSNTRPTLHPHPTPHTPPKNSTRPTRPSHLGGHKDPLITIRPHARERRHDRQRPSKTHPTLPTHPKPSTRPTPSTYLPHLDEEVWTLYGLFQLSSHLVCNGTALSPNICEMDCNNLIDDNISDDISCLVTFLNQLVTKGFRAPTQKELSRMIRLIFQEECSIRDASEYFAECA